MEIENAEFAGFNTLPVEGRARYPAMPAHHGDLSSREAAASIATGRPALWTHILQELAKGPGNADAIAKRAGLSFLAIRPRVTELAQLEAIHRTALPAKSVHLRRQATYILSAGPLDPEAPPSLREAHADALKLAKLRGTIVSGIKNN